MDAYGSTWSAQMVQRELWSLLLEYSLLYCICYITSSISKDSAGRAVNSHRGFLLPLTSPFSLHFSSSLLFLGCVSCVHWTFSRDSVCLLYLRPLYLLKQPHLLILLVAKFTATRLRPVLGLMPQWMANVPAADSRWKKKKTLPLLRMWACC